MNTFSARGLTLLLVTMLVAPTAFFIIAPQRVAAAGVGCVGGLIGGLGASAGEATISVPVNSMVGNAINGSTAGATIGTCINDLIIVPLIRLEIQNLLQKMTSSIVNWINGSNGTGNPSYVPNLSVHLQLVGDSVALPLIVAAATQFNSPFGSAIAASLQKRYAQQTSVAGFVAANQCTLNQSSPNINSYLAGNWSQGGTGAWFALTGPTPNNPYILQQATQAQIQSNVNQAQTNRRQDLVQSKGFLSWCGGGTTNIRSLNGIAGVAATCISNGVQQAFQTPGSIIADYANKGIASAGFDQTNALLVSANDINSAFSAITQALINQVLGGPGGLFGASQPSSAAARPLTTQMQNYVASNSTASASAASTAQSIQANVSAYTSAWQTILNAANAAAANVTSLATFCTTAATANATSTTFVAAATAQATAAQTAVTSEVQPVITQAQTAISSVANTQSFALKVQSEAAASSAGGAATLPADIQTLVTMPPSVIDLTTAQQNTQTSSAAKANPVGSLTVSGGTLIDQMNLINANATALRSACIPPPAP